MDERQTFETSVSPTTVSTLVKAWDAERAAFQSRRLADEYAYLVSEAMFVQGILAPAPRLRGARRSECVEERPILLVRGIKADGTRELRCRTRPMGSFQGLASCDRLVYVAIHKLSPERRNAVPYSLWTSQPWCGSRRRRRPTPVPPADLVAL